MKKLLFLMLGILAAAGCSDKENYNNKQPDAAYYSDWDRAIRYDVDMQNMYANAPLKL